MNKKEKEEKITQIADIVTFEIRNKIYDEINEHIFDQDLVKKNFANKTYQKVYKKIYDKIIWRLGK